MSKKRMWLLLLVAAAAALTGCDLISVSGLHGDPYEATVEVLDDTGSGLPGVLVKVDGEAEAITGDNGTASLKNLQRPVEVTVQGMNLDYLPESRQIDRDNNHARFFVDMVFDAEVLVRDGNGDPVQNVDIRIGGITVAVTNENGRTLLRNLETATTVKPVRQGWDFDPEEYTVRPGDALAEFEGTEI